MSLVRDFKTRKIIITYIDDVIGEQSKEFDFEQKKEALAFAENEFNKLAM